MASSPPDISGSYSSKQEAVRIFTYLTSSACPFDAVSLPPEIFVTKNGRRTSEVVFTAGRDRPYFPIPFKQTETGAALKAVEGSVAAALLAEKRRENGEGGDVVRVRVDLEKTTAFLFQAYLARIGGLGKLDKGVREFLKDTDLLQAQSNPYRRMAANLYRTKDPGEYYHIHGSLEASRTLRMLGLETHRPDLTTHEEIVAVIGGAVGRFTADELEALNNEHRQAGAKAYKHADFVKTPHGKANINLPPWSVTNLESTTPKTALPNLQPGDGKLRPLAGIKVVELCRVIAGPAIARILAEYGAEVIKVTGPHLSDVPFFQVDGNMGKRTVDLDLRTPSGRDALDRLLDDADVFVDGYRPGALSRLGYGPDKLVALAERRGKGIVYVSECCFGFEGEWKDRAGWQQIADCVSGVAWEQGRFMGLDEPVVPPFPISDYGAGCIGAVTALIGLYHRCTRGGSWHGKASLLQYDLLLFRAGLLPREVQDELRTLLVDRDGTDEGMARLRHHHSVDEVSGVALGRMRRAFAGGFVDGGAYLQRWFAARYGREVAVVRPVVEIDGLEGGFGRASRPNGSDEAAWAGEGAGEGDYAIDG